MKKNKLTLAAGILLIIAASFSILESLSLIESFFSVYIMPEEIIVEESYQLFLMIGQVIVIVLILLQILQSIAYMILGVKIVKRTNKKVPFVKMKTIAIVALVFSSIGILCNYTIINPMLVAVVVLLSCALARGDKFLSENTPSDVVVEASGADLLVEKAQVLKDLKDKNIINQEEFETMLNTVINTQNKDNQSKEVQDEDKKDVI